MADPRIPGLPLPGGQGLRLLPGGRVDEREPVSAGSAWARRVAEARRVLAVGEGPGAIAQLVVRPGLRLLGRRYRRDGSNRLGGYVRTHDELRQVAMHEPVTVAPSHAYVVVDVDYGAADTAAASERMAHRVGEFCDRVASTGIDVVRVRSGGYCDHEVKVGPHGPLEEEGPVQPGPFGRLEAVPDDQLVDTPPLSYGQVVHERVGDDGFGVQTRRYYHEHLWIVTGWHTMAVDVRTWVARRLRTVLPGCQIVGGARVGGLDGQQVRPPGSRHRTTGWPDGFDYRAVFGRLAATDPPQGCFEAFALVLAAMHHDTISARRHQIHLRTTPRSAGLAAWAIDYLDAGIPDTLDRARWYPDGVPTGTDLTRSGQFARLVGHLLVNGWTVADIVERLAASPASKHLAERQGHQTLVQRVATDVERIAEQHRTRSRPHAPLVVHQVAAAWPDMTEPEGTTSRALTHSGRMVMAALCRHAVRTGYLTVLAQRRTLAVEAGVSKSTADRALHRWVDLGALKPLHNDVGELVDVELVPDVLARLLPDRVSGTSSVHAPHVDQEIQREHAINPELDELLRRHDAWLARPAGSANISVPLGRAAQTVAGWLALNGSARVEDIADALQVSPGHVADVLARLRYHLIAWQRDGIWQIQTDVPVLTELLEHAATLQNTAGLLEQRRVRYLDQIQDWQAASAVIGVVQADVDQVIAQLREYRSQKQPRAPGGAMGATAA